MEINELAEEMAGKYWLSGEAALMATATYAEQLADDPDLYDGRITLTPMGADLVRSQFEADYQALDDGQWDSGLVVLVRDVARVKDRIDELGDHLRAAQIDLSDHVRQAMAGGVPVSKLAETLGVGTKRVYQIRDGVR